VVICDEVYEHMVFDGRCHIPFATVPGMKDRAVRVGSAGKMFSLTGWKIGRLMGPAHLVTPDRERALIFYFFHSDRGTGGDQPCAPA